MRKSDSDMPFLPLHDPQRVCAEQMRSDVKLKPWRVASVATTLGSTRCASLRSSSTLARIIVG